MKGEEGSSQGGTPGLSLSFRPLHFFKRNTQGRTPVASSPCSSPHMLGPGSISIHPKSPPPPIAMAPQAPTLDPSPPVPTAPPPPIQGSSCHCPPTPRVYLASTISCHLFTFLHLKNKENSRTYPVELWRRLRADTHDTSHTVPTYRASRP